MSSKEIIKKVQFPIVYTDKLNTPLYSRNIDQNKNKDEMLKLIKSMDKNNNPIPIEYYDSGSNSKMLLGYLHFGDSILVQRLEWLPYLEILIVLMFVIVGFLGFNSIPSISFNLLTISFHLSRLFCEIFEVRSSMS